MQDFSSKLLENTVNQLSKLPGIGKRTALRLALHILNQPKEDVDVLVDAISTMRHQIYFCESCYNLSDAKKCEICSNSHRDSGLLCVIQDIRDVMAVENTRVYKGVYHVLGGVISPINGVGPKDLHLESLFNRIENEDIKEVILALPTTTEGDTTAYYIYKHVSSIKHSVLITTIARGLSIGDELEYADEITLGRSLLGRIDFETSVLKK